METKREYNFFALGFFIGQLFGILILTLFQKGII
jgi:hypothetical protein